GVTGQAFLGAEPTNQDHLMAGGGRVVGGRCEDACRTGRTCACGGGGSPRWGTAGRLSSSRVASARAEGTADGDADPADRRRPAGALLPRAGPDPELRRAGQDRKS